MCSIISPVLVFYVLQGSGVTSLKCDEIYDMDFVAKFHGEYDGEKNLENRSTCQTF